MSPESFQVLCIFVGSLLSIVTAISTGLAAWLLKRSVNHEVRVAVLEKEAAHHEAQDGELAGKIKESEDRVEARIDGVEDRLGARLDGVAQSLRELRAEVRRMNGSTQHTGSGGYPQVAAPAGDGGGS